MLDQTLKKKSFFALKRCACVLDAKTQTGLLSILVVTYFFLVTSGWWVYTPQGFRTAPSQAKSFLANIADFPAPEDV